VRIRSRFLTKFAGWLVAFVFRALSRTLRLRGAAEAEQTDCSIETRRGYIYVLWHDAILLPLARQARQRSNVAALVSRHQDGAYLAEFMRHIGIHSIRGSTARGGDQALRELIRLGDEWHIFITPDGPRGPEHIVKAGLVYLASCTGRPVIPMASHCGSAWHLRGSWTGLLVPRPFSRGWYLLGEPLTIPPDLSRDEIEFHRARVQSEMERLERKLAGIIAGEGPAADCRRAA
jgi:lysophospholipid acyltransferase (LPLAT)-like uncharacterized protein